MTVTINQWWYEANQSTAISGQRGYLRRIGARADLVGREARGGRGRVVRLVEDGRVARHREANDVAARVPRLKVLQVVHRAANDGQKLRGVAVGRENLVESE